MPKTKARPEATKPATTTLHVPRKLHQQIRIVAGYRDEDLQELVVKALQVGLDQLTPPGVTFQPCAN